MKIRPLYVMLILALVALGASYVKCGLCNAQEKGYMNCTLTNALQCGSENCRAPGISMLPRRVTMTGSVVTVSKDKKKVTLRVELPIADRAASVLSKVKVGETLTATVTARGKGNPVVSEFIEDSARKAASGVDGIRKGKAR